MISTIDFNLLIWMYTLALGTFSFLGPTTAWNSNVFPRCWQTLRLIQVEFLLFLPFTLPPEFFAPEHINSVDLLHQAALFILMAINIFYLIGLVLDPYGSLQSSAENTNDSEFQ